MTKPDRMVTPDSGIPQNLAPLQLVNWIPRAERTAVPIQIEVSESTESKGEEEATVIARKLTFSNEARETKPTMAEVLKDNRLKHQGMKLNYYAPIMKDGVKVVKLKNSIENGIAD